MTDTDPATTDPESPKGDDYKSDRDFCDFPISENTLQGIHSLGFVSSTPVQDATIDAAVAGRDLIVRAKTGTGKTAAFSVPIVERTPEGARHPYALILEPTRELAQQTAEQLVAIAKFRDVSVATLVGGVAIGPQEDVLSRGAEIIVGTPGRVMDHIRRRNLNPSEIRMICLDEADEMLSMGFYEDVTKIMDTTHDERQVLLYSATISPETQRLVRRYLKEPEEIMLSTDADGVELIDHVIYESTLGLHKARALLYVLDIENPTSAIIFCNTREDTATVATFLDRQGLDAQLISGELSQARRSAVMRRVKAGDVRFLVATDVASRGIDISDLSHVINYSLPQDPSVYLHRTGRTGRIGKSGTAISLVGATDLHTRNLLERRHEIDFENRELPDAETAVKMRVERQAAQIKHALGTLVFESYLPTVKALLERPDGHMLLAATLRAFFQWDRQRRAEATGESTVDAIRESRNAKHERRKGRDDDQGRSRSNRRRHDDDSRGSRGKPRGRQGGRPQRRDDDVDLDSLLSVDSDDVLSVSDRDDPKSEGKKRKRKRKPKTEVKNSDAGGDDLDALLSLD
jgi:ATP-dependent RNA helicase DeaD